MLFVMTEQEKILRDKRILDLHNSGESMGSISKTTGMSKSAIHKIIGSIIKKEEVPSKKVVKVEVKGTEERISSFSGLTRTDVNEYLDEKTGEVIRVAFVKATEPGGFGYFVKLEYPEKKIDLADDDSLTEAK
jgi:predicted transcriptional regulator